MDDLQKKLDGSVKVLSFTHVSNVLGSINPVKEIVEMGKKVGALVVVDGAQAITQADLTVKTTSALINFAPGDVIHDEEGNLMGMVKTVNSATEMTMTTNLVTASVDDRDLYNISPIQLILGGTV